jgi:hexosaminidase
MLLACLALAGPAGWGAEQPLPGLIPRPQELAWQEGSFLLTPATEVRVSAQPEARRIGDYFAALLHKSGGPALRVLSGKGGAAAVSFSLDPAADARAESYRLQVSPQGIRVTAREPAGLFYGAVTLWQLCTPVQGGTLHVPAVRIADAPRLRWRGLMLDSARHFQSPQFVMDYIDWMALHKLNVLAWHLTDDQGWRLEIRKYPRLTGVGAWRVPAGAAAAADLDPATGRPRLYGGFYSQADVRRIVAHAAARHVTLVPEIDLPGHTTAAIVAYPQLASTPQPPTQVPSDWGIYPNLLNADESTFRFLQDVMDEVMALFPGRYVHAGGDEAVKDQWRASAQVQARMRELGIADEKALQGYFTARVARYLQSHGRTLVGWDEILEGGVPQDAVVMSWRGVQGALAAAAAGHDVVLSPDPVLYFDHRQGSSPAEPPGRGAVLTVQDVYAFDPLPGALAQDARHLLGIQANLWTEHVRTEERAAYMTYPRAAALAEVAWSAPGGPYEDFLGRLAPQLARYRALGIPHAEDAFAAPRTVAAGERHMSQDLSTCSNKLVLSLEDDAPVRGPRAVFLIDIMDPCWRLPGVDLSAGAHLTAAVGQVPFNFQLGTAAAGIHLNPPATASGELEVRIDRCDGAPAAALSLAPALGRDAVTALPAAALPPVPGVHELCLRFTQAQLDPMWAIDWVQVGP